MLASRILSVSVFLVFNLTSDLSSASSKPLVPTPKWPLILFYLTPDSMTSNPWLHTPNTMASCLRPVTLDGIPVSVLRLRPTSGSHDLNSTVTDATVHDPKSLLSMPFALA